MEPDETEEGAVVEQRVPEEPETEEASLNMGDSVATTPGFLTPMCWPREAPYPAPEPEPSQYAPPQVGALCDTHPVAADMFSTTFLTEQTVENDEEEPEPEPEPDPEPELETYTSTAAVYQAITGFHGSHEFLSWDADQVATWLREQVDYWIKSSTTKFGP